MPCSDPTWNMKSPRLDARGCASASRAFNPLVTICYLPPLVSKLRLREAAAVAFDHLGAEHLGAEAGVLLGVGTAQLVVHVQRRGAVSERPEQMPEAGRVGAARDEAGDPAAGVHADASALNRITPSSTQSHERPSSIC